MGHESDGSLYHKIEGSRLQIFYGKFDRRLFLRMLAAGVGTEIALETLKWYVDSIPSAQERSNDLFRSLQVKGTAVDVILGTVAIGSRLEMDSTPRVGLGVLQNSDLQTFTHALNPIRYRIPYSGSNYDQRYEDYLVTLTQGNGLVFYSFSNEAQQYIHPEIGGRIAERPQIRATVERFTPSTNLSGKMTQPIVMCKTVGQQYDFPIGQVLKINL